MIPFTAINANIYYGSSLDTVHAVSTVSTARRTKQQHTTDATSKAFPSASVTSQANGAQLPWRCSKLCASLSQDKQANTIVFDAGEKGAGLKALEDISSGFLVIEYIGEVISQAEGRRRCDQYDEQQLQHMYFLLTRGGALIDATQQGNNARYINHSCDPNCQAQSCLVEGRERVGIVAIKAIPTGQEITYDYHAKPSGVPVVRCLCKSTFCRGFLDADDTPTSRKEPQSLPVPANAQAGPSVPQAGQHDRRSSESAETIHSTHTSLPVASEGLHTASKAVPLAQPANNSSAHDVSMCGDGRAKQGADRSRPNKRLLPPWGRTQSRSVTVKKPRLVWGNTILAKTTSDTARNAKQLPARRKSHSKAIQQPKAQKSAVHIEAMPRAMPAASSGSRGSLTSRLTSRTVSELHPTLKPAVPQSELAAQSAQQQATTQCAQQQPSMQAAEQEVSIQHADQEMSTEHGQQKVSTQHDKRAMPAQQGQQEMSIEHDEQEQAQHTQQQASTQHALPELILASPEVQSPEKLQDAPQAQHAQPTKATQQAQHAQPTQDTQQAKHTRYDLVTQLAQQGAELQADILLGTGTHFPLTTCCALTALAMSPVYRNRHRRSTKSSPQSPQVLEATQHQPATRSRHASPPAGQAKSTASSGTALQASKKPNLQAARSTGPVPVAAPAAAATDKPSPADQGKQAQQAGHQDSPVNLPLQAELQELDRIVLSANTRSRETLEGSLAATPMAAQVPVVPTSITVAVHTPAAPSGIDVSTAPAASTRLKGSPAKSSASAPLVAVQTPAVSTITDASTAPAARTRSRASAARSSAAAPRDAVHTSAAPISTDVSTAPAASSRSKRFPTKGSKAPPLVAVQAPAAPIIIDVSAAPAASTRSKASPAKTSAATNTGAAENTAAPITVGVFTAPTASTRSKASPVKSSAAASPGAVQASAAPVVVEVSKAAAAKTRSKASSVRHIATAKPGAAHSSAAHISKAIPAAPGMPLQTATEASKAAQAAPVVPTSSDGTLQQGTLSDAVAGTDMPHPQSRLPGSTTPIFLPALSPELTLTLTLSPPGDGSNNDGLMPECAAIPSPATLSPFAPSLLSTKSTVAPGNVATLSLTARPLPSSTSVGEPDTVSNGFLPVDSGSTEAHAPLAVAAPKVAQMVLDSTQSAAGASCPQPEVLSHAAPPNKRPKPTASQPASGEQNVFEQAMGAANRHSGMSSAACKSPRPPRPPLSPSSPSALHKTAVALLSKQRLFNGGFPVPKPRMPSRFANSAAQRAQQQRQLPVTPVRQPAVTPTAEDEIDIMSVSEADQAAANAWRQQQRARLEPFLHTQQLLSQRRAVTPAAKRPSAGIGALHPPVTTTAQPPAGALLASAPAVTVRVPVTNQAAGPKQPATKPPVIPCPAISDNAAVTKQQPLTTSPSSPVPASTARPSAASHPSIIAQPTVTNVSVASIQPAATVRRQGCSTASNTEDTPPPGHPLAAQPAVSAAAQTAVAAFAQTARPTPSETAAVISSQADANPRPLQHAVQPLAHVPPGHAQMAAASRPTTALSTAGPALTSEPVAAAVAVLGQQHSNFASQEAQQAKQGCQNFRSVAPELPQQQHQQQQVMQSDSDKQAQSTQAAQPEPELTVGVKQALPAQGRSTAAAQATLQAVQQSAAAVGAGLQKPTHDSSFHLAQALSATQGTVLLHVGPSVQAAQQTQLLPQPAPDLRHSSQKQRSGLQSQDQAKLHSMAQRKVLRRVKPSAVPPAEDQLLQTSLHKAGQVSSVPSSEAAAVHLLPVEKSASQPHALSQVQLVGRLIDLHKQGPVASCTTLTPAMVLGHEGQSKQVLQLADVTHSPKRNLRAWKTVQAETTD